MIKQSKIAILHIFRLYLLVYSDNIACGDQLALRVKGVVHLAVTHKVKALLELKHETNTGLAKHLGITTQALHNKYHRDSYSAADLIKIADYLGVELAFIVDERQRFVFSPSDVKQKNAGKGTES